MAPGKPKGGGGAYVETTVLERQQGSLVPPEKTGLARGLCFGRGGARVSMLLKWMCVCVKEARVSVVGHGCIDIQYTYLVEPPKKKQKRREKHPKRI